MFERCPSEGWIWKQEGNERMERQRWNLCIKEQRQSLGRIHSPVPLLFPPVLRAAFTVTILGSITSRIWKISIFLSLRHFIVTYLLYKSSGFKVKFMCVSYLFSDQEKEHGTGHDRSLGTLLELAFFPSCGPQCSNSASAASTRGAISLACLFLLSCHLPVFPKHLFIFINRCIARLWGHLLKNLFLGSKREPCERALRTLDCYAFSPAPKTVSGCAGLWA